MCVKDHIDICMKYAPPLPNLVQSLKAKVAADVCFSAALCS